METHASMLVHKYLSLGGRRKSAADDNAISTRLWSAEPKAAEDFWLAEIAPLPADGRQEVESLLPSISGDSP